MSFWLRLCLGLLVLAPSLAVAQQTDALDVPGNGHILSGIGTIYGWKCEANGEITIVLDEGDPNEVSIPATYGFPRGDTSAVCGDDGNNGFYSFFN